MPRRMRIMQDDSIHLPITTGSAAVLYGWTLQELVLILWAVYVLVLIVIKVPDLTTSVVRIQKCLRARVEKWRGRDED